jgi:hypothetical protein
MDVTECNCPFALAKVEKLWLPRDVDDLMRLSRNDIIVFIHFEIDDTSSAGMEILV